MDTLIIEPNPMSPGKLVVGDLSKSLHMSQGSLDGEIDAEVRKLRNDRKMNPTKYSLNENPEDIYIKAAQTVRERHEHPELNIESDESNSADENYAVSANRMDEMDTAAMNANAMNPMANVNSDAMYDNQMKIDTQETPLSPDAVNADSGMTNQSVGNTMDYINDIQPDTEQFQSPEDEAKDVAGAMSELGDVYG